MFLLPVGIFLKSVLVVDIIYLFITQPHTLHIGRGFTIYIDINIYLHECSLLSTHFLDELIFSPGLLPHSDPFVLLILLLQKRLDSAYVQKPCNREDFQKI